MKVVVFDFDGTCTVPAAGADNAFIAGHAIGFAQMLGEPLEWVMRRYADIRAIVIADPSRYGWVINGRIEAPALVDSFVAAQVYAQEILRERGEDVSSWDERLNRLYQDNYLKYVSEFRQEFESTFIQVGLVHKNFAIVTNSDPKKIEKRLIDAFGEERGRTFAKYVHGFAMKYLTTEGPGHLEPHIEFPGLNRPVSIRKQHYYDVLTALLEEHGADWSDLVVVGDIAELDLALPVTLGASGYLIRGHNTPAYEIAWAEAHPRVKVIENLLEPWL